MSNQETEKALETPAKSLNETSLVAWFYKILRNTLTDHYRARGAEERKNREFGQLERLQGKQQVAPMDEIEAAVCACMDGLLPTLKDSYSELIQRIDLKNESIAEVTKDLGISENSLSVRLFRARQALKVSLERTCGTCTEHG